MMLKDKIMKKLIPLAVFILIAVLSITVVSKYATSFETHASTIEVLDEKKSNALVLNGAVALTSTVLAAVPGDATTAISNQIAELTTPLFIVVCALYLEKFLLTTLGYVSFVFLIPASCVLLGAYVFYKKDVLKTLAIKLTVFALAIYLIIPTSVKVSSLIEETFDKSISQTLKSVEEIAEEAEEASNEKNTNIFSETISKLTGGMKKFAEKAKTSLGIFVDAVAIMIITTCVIPIAVILFFVWIIKTLFGISVDTLRIKRLKSEM